MSFTPFDFNPISTTVRTGGYTVPAQRFALVTAFSNDFTIDGVSAIPDTINFIIPANNGGTYQNSTLTEAGALRTYKISNEGYSRDVDINFSPNSPSFVAQLELESSLLAPITNVRLDIFDKTTNNSVSLISNLTVPSDALRMDLPTTVINNISLTGNQYLGLSVPDNFTGSTRMRVEGNSGSGDFGDWSIEGTGIIKFVIPLHTGAVLSGTSYTISEYGV